MTDRGWALGVHTAGSGAKARQQPLSDEEIWWEEADMRSGDGKALELINAFHLLNKSTRGRNGFVWTTPGLLEIRSSFFPTLLVFLFSSSLLPFTLSLLPSTPAVVQRQVVERSEHEQEEAFKKQFATRIQKDLTDPLHSDAEVELSNLQCSFILATCSSGGVDLDTDPSFVDPKTVSPLADSQELEKLQRSISAAYSYKKRPKAQHKPKQVSVAQKVHFHFPASRTLLREVDQFPFRPHGKQTLLVRCSSPTETGRN